MMIDTYPLLNKEKILYRATRHEFVMRRITGQSTSLHRSGIAPSSLRHEDVTYFSNALAL